ncbi:MAG TPA: hypothetical protein ENN40_11325 [Candidatus Aminicenantes bacterium]|nr:hypothetical protein [Candidatus Aminicenantes bacterium]
MKRLYKVVAAFLAGALVTVLVVRLGGHAASDPGMAFQNAREMILSDLDGNRLCFLDLVSSGGETCCLFFRLNQCYSCIFRGMEDLKLLQQQEKNCFAVAVHDSIEDVRGWLTHESFHPVYVMSRAAFLRHVTCRSLPVIVRLEKSRVIHCEYPVP